MEQSLRPFARRHGPDNLRKNVVAGHYGVVTGSPCGTGGLTMTFSTFRVCPTYSEYIGIVRTVVRIPVLQYMLQYAGHWVCWMSTRRNKLLNMKNTHL